MSSHFAQIAFFLWKITGTQKYKSFVDEWNTGWVSGSYIGKSMRGQLREVSLSGGNGYVWAASFGAMSGSNDIEHANAEVEMMVLDAEMNNYWNQNDMDNLGRTLDQLILKGNSWNDAAYYIDGSGTGSKMITQGWSQLGRFNQDLQNKLASRDLLPTYYYYQKAEIANMAYNQAYLDGSLVYPEN